MSLAWAGYRALAPLVGALAPFGRGLASAPERALWHERLGEIPEEAPADAWIHAASLGEAVAVPGLVAALRAGAPHARLRLTATTRTGRDRLRALGEPASLAPLDAPQAAQRFMARIRPRRLFLLETELWPHWLMAAHAIGAPVAVLSARISAGSLDRYRWLGRGFSQWIAGLAAVLCQSAADRERWVALGARPERTVTVGNLKNDGLPRPAADRPGARQALGLDPHRPLLVLGSLRPGEAAVLASAWQGLPAALRRQWQVVAVPRHSRASEALRREAIASGVAVAGGALADPEAWGWDDRAGVLLGYYGAADVAFVGGTLQPYGGHNPLEPAACGAAVLVGSHLESQGPAAATLEAAGALDVVRAESLPLRLRELLENVDERTARAQAGLRAADQARGAARRAVARLEAWGLWP